MTVVAFAESEAKPEADAALLYAGAYGYPYTYGAYPYGFRSYAYGAYPYAYGAHYIGKREAEEEAAPAKALAAHPYGATSFVGETVWGFPAAKAVEKREAEPAVGYSNRSPQGAYAYGWAPAYYW